MPAVPALPTAFPATTVPTVPAAPSVAFVPVFVEPVPRVPTEAPPMEASVESTTERTTEPVPKRPAVKTASEGTPESPVETKMLAPEAEPEAAMPPNTQAVVRPDHMAGPATMQHDGSVTRYPAGLGRGLPCHKHKAAYQGSYQNGSQRVHDFPPSPPSFYAALQPRVTGPLDGKPLGVYSLGFQQDG